MTLPPRDLKISKASAPSPSFYRPVMNEHQGDVFINGTFQLPELTIGLRRVRCDDTNHSATGFDPLATVGFPA